MSELSEKLMSCPFCGGEAKMTIEARYADGGWGKTYRIFYVSCKDCEARTRAFNDIDNPRDSWEKAAEAWNDRVNSRN